MDYKMACDLPYSSTQQLKYAAETLLNDALFSTSELLCTLKQTAFDLSWPRPIKTIPYELRQIAKALIAKEVVKHPDMYVNISVSCCISHIVRIYPVKPPYNDRQLKEFFELVVTTFEKLSSASGGCFTEMSEVLEIFRALGLPVLMLEMHLDASVVRLFKQFLTVSESNSTAIVRDMEKIMTMIIEEGDEIIEEGNELIPELARLLVTSVKTENQIASPACYQLAEKVLKNCAARLKPYLADMVRGDHKGLTKKQCAESYKAVKEKRTDEEPKTKKGNNKTRIRCRLDLFIDVLKSCSLDQHKIDVIKTTPFARLLDFQEGSLRTLSLKRDMIKSLVRNFSDDQMTLTVNITGSNTQVVPITVKDFSFIMGIRSGNVEEGDTQEVAEEIDESDLISKYCILGKNEQYKYIDIKKVAEELRITVDDNVIKQTFALIALHYIVCPTPAGVLGKKYLSFVKNVHKQPWANMAMDALKHGIQTFNNGTGVEKSLGGCVLFLQLYCMNLRGLNVSKNVSEINEEAIENFYKRWMKRKKFLAEKICKDFKELSDLIKANSEKVELRLLVELSEFNEKCKTEISAGRDDQNVRHTLNVGSDQLQKLEPISASDIQRLEPGNWLNDEVINFYLRYLEQTLSPTNGASSAYHFFSTFFYKKLMTDVLLPEGTDANLFEKFRKWWRSGNILEKEYLVIPIHQDSHWSVVIICMRNKTDNSEPILLHLDSSVGFHDTSQICNNIRRFIEVEANHGSMKSIVGSVEGVSVKVSQQPNSFDCGAYALLFIEHFINKAPNRMGKEYTEMFRKCFGDEEVGDLRNKIKSLLIKGIEKHGGTLYTRKKVEKKPGDSGDATGGKRPGDSGDVTVTPKRKKKRVKYQREMKHIDQDPDVQISNIDKRVLRNRDR